jgi:hypothetical protein
MLTRLGHRHRHLGARAALPQDPQLRDAFFGVNGDGDLADHRAEPIRYAEYASGPSNDNLFSASGAIHGSWHDLEQNHLESVNGRFYPNTDAAPERPQPLFAMALTGMVIAQEYIDKCLADAKDLFNPRFDDLLDRLGQANALHEDFLTRRFDSEDAGTE